MESVPNIENIILWGMCMAVNANTYIFYTDQVTQVWARSDQLGPSNWAEMTKEYNIIWGIYLW